MKMKRKRTLRTVLSLFMAVIIAGQGTAPLFVYAKEISGNTPRVVEFEQPDAIERVEDVLSPEEMIGTGEPMPQESNHHETSELHDSGNIDDEDVAKEPETENLTEKVEQTATEDSEIGLREPEVYYPLPEEPAGTLVEYDETFKSYKQEDGSYITQYGGYMGVYKDENGEIQKVENKLVEPRVRSAAGAYVNKANDYQIILPKQITEYAGIVLEKEGKRLEIIPISGDYSKAVVKDNAVLYNQVYDGIDVQYTVVDNNVKEDIVLHKPTEHKEFKYELIHDGMIAEEKDGIVYLYEQDKSPEDAVYLLEAPIMIDAAQQTSMNIRLTLQEEEGKTYLVVTPDQEWLNNEKRQYPVRIDPTTVTVTREAFSMIGVEQGAPDTYIGDNSYPYVGYDDGIKSGNLQNFGQLHMICRTYVKVYSDFSAIPKDSKIDRATFSVSQRTNYSGGASQFGLYRVDTEWGEYATWVDQPAVHTFIDVQNSKANANEYINYNVKDMVNDWIQGTYANYGMVLKAIDEANGLDASMQCEVLNNKGSVYGPMLTIQWSPSEDPYLRDMPIEDLSIQVRPMTEKSVQGKLQFDAVFPDGISKSKSVVEYYLSPDEETKEKHHAAEAQGNYKYPDNTEYLTEFPEATKYKSKDSNWQGAMYSGLELDKLYQFKATAEKDGKSSGEKTSDSFVIYKIKQFDTFPKIAKYYGIPLADIMKDNHVQDALVIENNTIFIRNPKTNIPYSPEPLTETDKRRIDGALMGRGLHCEFGFEPVNLNTGNFFMEQSDAVLPELNGEFSILRSYNSKGTDQNSMFGRGWSFTYDQSLSKTEDGSVVFTRGDGSYLYLTPNGDGTYQAPKGYDYELKEVVYENTDHDYIGYELTDTEKTVWAFDKYGVLRYFIDYQGFKTTLDYDEDYNLRSITTPSGKVFGIGQNEQGYITSVTLPDGSVVTYEYNDTNNLIKVTNANGTSRTYAYDDKNRIVSWQDENGNTVVTNEYDDKNRVVIQTDAKGGKATFVYEDGKTTTTDNEGHTTVYHYDDQYRTTSIEYPDGTVESNVYEGNMLVSTTTAAGTTSYTYDTAGNILTETRVDGAVRSYTYNEWNLPTSVTDYDGSVTVMQYDESGNLISVTDPNGAVTTYVYDELHRMISQINANGVTTSYGYDGVNLVSYIDGNGNTWTYDYDAMNRRTGTTDPLGYTTATAYDAVGNIISETAGDGGVTAYELDAVGNILAVTDPVGNRTEFEYDAMDNQIKSILPDGGEICYEYDKNYREVKQTDPNGNVISTEYDAMGRVVSKSSEDAGTIRFGYDGAGNLISAADGRGNETVSEYNALGLQTTTTDAEGNVLTNAYNAAGLVTEIVYPDGGRETFTYDGAGNLVSDTDVLGVTTTYTYDGVGQLLSATDQDGRTISYTYDNNGNLLSVTNPDNGVISYAYDAANRRISVTDEEGRTERYEYDGEDRIVRLTDAAGYTNAFTYNGNGDILSSTDGNGNIHQFTYDTQSHMTSMTDAEGYVNAMKYDSAGNLKETIDPLNGVTVYEHDSRGNVIKMVDALEQVYTYAYDKTGNQKTVTLPNGDTMSMKYDKVNRLKEVTDAQGLTITYTYDSMGRIAKAEDSEGHSMEYTYDAAGNMTSQTDNLGRKAEYVYDVHGRLVTVTTADGSVTSYEYDVLDQMTAVTDAEGHRTTFTYDKAGNRLSLSKSDAVVYQYAYDQRNRVVSETDPLGAATTFAYDGNDNLTSVTDANGNTITYTYDSNNNLIQEKDGRESIISYEYDAADHMIRETSPEGAVKEYVYDALGNLTKYKDPMKLITEYQYDSVGNMIKEISPKGAETGYTYDKHGYVTQVTDPLGNVTGYELDALGNVITMTQANGGQYHYQYDGAGRLEKITTPLGYVKNFAYDKADNLLQETDSLKQTTVYTYDRLHNLLTKTDASGAVSAFRYDERSNLITETDPLGRTRQYTYDVADRMIQEADPQGKLTEYQYDPVGNLTGLTKPGDRTTKLDYDSNYNVISVTDPMGYVTTSSYDKDNRLLRITDALKQSEEYSYDADSRVTAVTDREGGTEKYEYDPHGNITTIVDKTGVKTHLSYDENDNLIQVEDPLGGKTTYAYDAMNQMSVYTDALGRKTEYTYDLEGNLTSQTDGAGRIDTMKYDEMGRMISYVSPGGKVTNYDYDKLNRLVEKLYEDSEGTKTDAAVRYTYNGAGERISMQDATGTSDYEYDELGRIIKTTNGSGKTIQYEYNEADNLQAVIYPDGSKVSYEYDLNDNLIKVTDRNGGVTEYTFDALNRMTGLIRPNGTKTNLLYDAENHVTKIVNSCSVCDTEISSYEYTYNAQGFIVSESASELEAGTRKVPGWDEWYSQLSANEKDKESACCHKEKTVKTTRKYEYDENWQLTRCTEKTVGGKTVVYNYTYDKVGNRTVYERIENGVSKEKYRYEYNEANQLVKRKNTKIWGDKGTTYTYDGDGNLIREKGNEYESSVLYEYTAENRLAVVKQGDAVLMAALYDGDNNRVFQIDNTYKWEDCYGEEVLIPESQRTEDGNSPQEQLAELFPKGADSKGYTLTEYINDINQENTEVLAEYTAGDTMRQAYIYGAESAISGEQIRQGVDKEGETGYYYLYDGRESVTGIQQNISLTNSYRYDPYGNLLSGTTDAINYYGYNAESTNVKTALQYLRARYYDTETGRFTSEDTETGEKEKPLSRNKYLYVLNNPLNYADPRGRFFKELWNTAKKGFKKAANWVNNHIVQPVKRAFKKAANWAADKVSSVCNAVSDWWDGVTNPAPVAYAGYNPYTYGYSTYTGGTRGNASYVPIQQSAAYMSDAEIGQLSSGYGLSGEQLVRYQKQRSEVIRKQMEKKVCSEDNLRFSDKLTIYWNVFKVVSKTTYEIGKSDFVSPSIDIDLDIEYNGATKEDLAKIGAGIVEIGAGAAGILLSGAAEVVSGGAATPGAAVAVGGSVTAMGTGAVTIGNALGNMFDVTVHKSQGNSSGGETEKNKKFPDNPEEFNPEGLTQKTFDTKNGKIMKWFDENGKAIYEWDEDIQNGSHYHVIGEDGNTRVPNDSGETHFQPGDLIP